jgi:RNA polymerase sigma-70 factor (ECF subfamily)
MQATNPPRLELDEHRPWIARLAQRLTSDAHTAEDLVQDVWLRALERPPRVSEGGGKLRGWLRVVTRNRATSGFRARGPERLYPSFADWTCPDSLDACAQGSGEGSARAGADAIDEDLRLALRSALRSLPRDVRHLMHLRYERDLTSTEIAESLGTPVGTIRGRLLRGRRMLRARLLSAHKARLPDWAVARLRA